jgi:GT2 family glycosyltransferase
MDMVLSIIIVNYKTPDLTIGAIESIVNSASVLYEIIIIDNASDDDSEELIRSKYSDIIWIQNEKNEGFGRANNRGIQLARGKYILLLNPDVIILDETLSACIEKFENDLQLGIIGCKLINEDGTHQKSTYSVASLRKLLDQNLIINKFWPMRNEPVEAVMGSFMLLSRQIFEEVGGFDPDFFMYSEELDLCYRIAKKGYTIKYFEGASAIHKNGGSTSDKKWAMKQRYLSNALLFLKVRGYLGYFLYHFLFLLNSLTNFFVMWGLDNQWRRSYWKTQKYYFSNFGYYFIIPFLYSRNPGNGKRLLKRNP